MREKAMRLRFIPTKSDGVRVYHKRKIDGVRVHHQKERWAES